MFFEERLSKTVWQSRLYIDGNGLRIPKPVVISEVNPRVARENLTIAADNGVRYAYSGNVHDRLGDATFCSACGEELIGRDWYALLKWNLDAEGRCPSCGTPCPGVFEAQPGTWGRKRLPVRLRDFVRRD